MEYGTEDRRTRPGGILGLRRGRFTGKVEPRPFLGRALAQQRGYVVAEISQALGQSVRDVFGPGGGR